MGDRLLTRPSSHYVTVPPSSSPLALVSLLSLLLLHSSNQLWGVWRRWMPYQLPLSLSSSQLCFNNKLHLHSHLGHFLPGFISDYKGVQCMLPCPGSSCNNNHNNNHNDNYSGHYDISNWIRNYTKPTDFPKLNKIFQILTKFLN